MERAIRYFFIGWLLLLGGTFLAQHLGWSRLAFWLLVLVISSLPGVVGALLAHVVLSLREAWRRAQVLRRASKWKRPRPTDDWWQYKNREQR